MTDALLESNTPADAKYFVDPVAKAAALGLAIVYPNPRELFLDIDSDADFAAFKKHVAIVIAHVEAWRSTPSPSGRSGRRHVVVTLKRELSDVERIAWQAALGSDRIRELLSLRNIANGNTRPPTLFFEKVEEKFP